VAPKIISSNSIATVVDDSGKICGELTKDQIIDILFIDKENNA
jgi:Mg/Co/Ni transporter MgtE